MIRHKRHKAHHQQHNKWQQRTIIRSCHIAKYQHSKSNYRVLLYTYPEWTISIQSYLGLIPAGGAYRVWDVVTGRYAQPTSEATMTTTQQWQDANAIALLTIRKNCENDVRARVGNISTAQAAYRELQKAYEGHTTTEFYALLDSISTIHFDDRKTAIEEHIARN